MTKTFALLRLPIGLSATNWLPEVLHIELAIDTTRYRTQ